MELYLKSENYTVYKFYDSMAALRCVQETELDLAILDVMMPGMDGFALCRKIREKYNFPVIMLTAKVEDIDKITGLTIGADDFVTNPSIRWNWWPVSKLNSGDLPATTGRLSIPDVIDFSGLVINRRTHECTLNERPLSLTPLSLIFLWMLCENRGQVISSERLFEEVWGEKYLNSNNTVMVHIRHLREKMGEQVGKPRFIKTVWGVGYKIE